MRQEDHGLLEPGMRVRIMPRLMGYELYDADDPEEYKKWLGKEVTVRYVKQMGEWFVGIEEEKGLDFYMEEIECIVDGNDVEIAESEEPIGILLGFIV